MKILRFSVIPGTDGTLENDSIAGIEKHLRAAAGAPVPGEFQITLKSKGFKRC